HFDRHAAAFQGTLHALVDRNKIRRRFIWAPRVQLFHGLTWSIDDPLYQQASTSQEPDPFAGRLRGHGRAPPMSRNPHERQEWHLAHKTFEQVAVARGQ